jgi:hypothetical protein
LRSAAGHPEVAPNGSGTGRFRIRGARGVRFIDHARTPLKCEQATHERTARRAVSPARNRFLPQHRNARPVGTEVATLRESPAGQEGSATRAFTRGEEFFATSGVSGTRPTHLPGECSADNQQRPPALTVSTDRHRAQSAAKPVRFSDLLRASRNLVARCNRTVRIPSQLQTQPVGATGLTVRPVRFEMWFGGASEFCVRSPEGREHNHTSELKR